MKINDQEGKDAGAFGRLPYRKTRRAQHAGTHAQRHELADMCIRYFGLALLIYAGLCSTSMLEPASPIQSKTLHVLWTPERQRGRERAASSQLVAERLVLVADAQVQRMESREHP